MIISLYRAAFLSFLSVATAWPFPDFSQVCGKPALLPRPRPLPAFVSMPAQRAEQLVPISDQYISVVPRKKPLTYVYAHGSPLNGYYDIQRMRPVPGSDGGSTYQYASTIGHMRQGIMQGEWKNHFLTKSGTLDYTETYRDGLLHGPFTVYNPNKTVRYQTNFDQGSGVWKSFYPTGQLKQTGRYQYGREHGSWLQYSPTGKVIEQLTYDNGTVKIIPPVHHQGKNTPKLAHP